MISLTLKDKEDNVNALTAFSSSPNTAAPSHVSAKPQCSKKASEEQDILFQAQIPHSTFQETFPQHWNEIWPFLQEGSTASHGIWLSNSYLKKN